MKYVFLLIPFFAQAQPKGANVIQVSGITFRQVATSLLDFEYSFEKIDSNFQTIRTEFKEMKDYVMKIQLDIRVKDSVAIIKGSWISGNTLFEIQNQKWPAYKATFKALNDFALSFNKPIEYK